MKKYSEKFISNFNILNTSIIGYEFEFYMKNMSFYKTLELLNQDLDPVKVHGFRNYHSDFKVDSKNFKIEPDLSGGPMLVELITGPMSYSESKIYLIKILKFIQKHGYTDDKSSIHFNLSFNGDKNLNDLNILKLILNTDEDEIFRFYPNRKGNIYSKSVKNIIPYRDYDFFNISIDSIKNSIKVPNDKYYGINFLNVNNDKETQRLEYRYIGGKDYEKNIGNILYFLDRFIIDSYNSIDVGFNELDADKLEKYLEKNIAKYKIFSKYDNFIVEYPKIQIQIDQNQLYEMNSSYFPRIYSKIWNLLESDSEIKECLINYVTKSQTIEIIDLTINSNLSLKNYDFINCDIRGGMYDNCNFYSCEISNSQISKSQVDNCDLSNSKSLDSNVENSILKECFFMGGHLNSEMRGGIYRSGEVGPYAIISPETKMVTYQNSFFHDKMEDDDKKIPSFKK